MSTPAGDSAFNHRFLIAVDGSPNAGRAVTYAARLLGGRADVAAVLLHVVNPPEDDYFDSPGAREAWIQAQRAAAARMLEDYRAQMIAAGFAPGQVQCRCWVERTPSLARTLAAQQAALDCTTLVVGRQGLSRREEFLFGSTSRMLVGCVRGSALWVVA